MQLLARWWMVIAVVVVAVANSDTNGDGGGSGTRPSGRSRRKLELTAGNACQICACLDGQNPRDVVKCDMAAAAAPEDGGAGSAATSLTVRSLPKFVRDLDIRGHPDVEVVVERGAIRVESADYNDATSAESGLPSSGGPSPALQHFRIRVRGCGFVEFKAKSVTLLGSNPRLDLEVGGCGEVTLRRRMVSADRGSVNVTVSGGPSPATAETSSASSDRAGTLTVEGQAFDVLSRVLVEGLATLNLSPLAFKPNLPPVDPEQQHQPGLRVRLVRLGSVPALPTDTFPSAAEVSVADCNVGDVEADAFSGFLMGQVSFARTAIDRIHGRAFPDKTLFDSLVFEGCLLSSVAERAVSSAVSNLELAGNRILSISRNAFYSPAAGTVVIANNTFATLSSDSFAFKAWNRFRFEGNDLKFVEGRAFAGVILDDVDGGGQGQEPGATLTFRDNRVHYANQEALAHSLPASVTSDFSGNLFLKACGCDFPAWLAAVASPVLDHESGREDFLDVAGMIMNTSFCSLGSGLALDCFGSPKALIAAYVEMFCPGDPPQEVRTTSWGGGCPTGLVLGDGGPVSTSTGGGAFWGVLQRRLEVETNRGILLVVLTFVLCASVLVGICTLVRWLVFLASASSKDERGRMMDDWNFTKVEERLMIPSSHEGSDDEDENKGSGSPEASGSSRGRGQRRHQSLALTTTEVLIESPPTSIKASPGSPGGDLKASTSAAAETTMKPLSPETGVKPLGDLAERMGLTTTGSNDLGPKQTFYDEMIDLLKEKLEDPENYATVADDSARKAGEAAGPLYQDPSNLVDET